MSQEALDMEEQKTPIKKKKSIFKLIVLIGLIFILFSVLSSFFAYIYVTNNSNSTEVVKIDKSNGINVNIPLGSGTTDIAKILFNKGIINHPTIFRVFSYINGYDNTYQSGLHILSKDLSYDEIMRVLGQPSDSKSIKVRVPEYYTFNQTVKLLKEKGIINEIKFRKTAKEYKFNYPFIKDIPERDNKLEGYLFPDTYFLEANASEEKIIGTMLNRFDDIFKQEYYDRAKELKMTVDQIITLASIIEREAKVDSERKRIAGVFYNRLHNSDLSLRKLQSCATVEYILLNKFGEIKEELTNEDTSIDNPYNTYQIEGLPPGPICSPGKKSIEAALYPEKNQYLYFAAKGNGSGEHYFSKTYIEHLRAVSLSNQ